MDLTQLEKLNELKEKGVLTQEEFDKEKGKLLAQKAFVETDESEKSLWGYFISCVGEKYVCFQGRARRKEYWGLFLGNLLIRVIIGFIFSVLIVVTDHEKVWIDMFNLVTVILNMAFALAFASVGIRRLHDVNLSGWWMLTLIVPMVVVPFFKGNTSENKYGPVPAGVLK